MQIINKMKNKKLFYSTIQGTLLLYIAICSTTVFIFLTSYHVKHNYDALYAKVDYLEQLIKTRTQEVDVMSLELNKDNFFRVCAYYNVQFDSIVFRQAVLESGNFTSYLCMQHNNFLGLYNSSTKDYYKFNHWSECIRGYRDLVQYKYSAEKYGEGYEGYYNFLKKLPYAEDSLYIQKLKGLFK